MGAAQIIPDASIVIPPSAIPTEFLAIAVAAASFTILGLTFLALGLDMRERRRAELEADRMRGLANAAVEGLLVCHAGKIVTVNSSLASLSQLAGGIHHRPRRCRISPRRLPRGSQREDGSDEPFETELVRADGAASRSR